MQSTTISKQKIIANRKREKSTTPGYLLFFFVASTILVIMCVYYLRLKTVYTMQKKKNEELMDELITMQHENEALKDSIYNSINPQEILEIAKNEYGMKYPDTEQIVYYEEPNTYIIQYGEIP